VRCHGRARMLNIQGATTNPPKMSSTRACSEARRSSRRCLSRPMRAIVPA
jgi:hypothetical protein